MLAITLGQYLAFLGISLVVICSPGQDTALTIRNTLVGRRSAGIATAAGISVGLTVWTVATSAGLAAILMASQPVFSAIRLAGAAYLFYLGAQALRHALRTSPDQPGHASPPPVAAGGQGGAIRRPFLQGLISNLSNPKILVFFTSLLPQFTGAHPGFATLAVLGINFSVVTLAWLSAYAVAVERMSHVLRRSGVRRAMEAILGTVLVAFGLRLATESR